MKNIKRITVFDNINIDKCDICKQIFLPLKIKGYTILYYNGPETATRDNMFDCDYEMIYVCSKECAEFAKLKLC